MMSTIRSIKTMTNMCCFTFINMLILYNIGYFNRLRHNCQQLQNTVKNKIEIHAIIMSISVLPSIIAELFMIFQGNTPNLKGNQDFQGVNQQLDTYFWHLQFYKQQVESYLNLVFNLQVYKLIQKQNLFYIQFGILYICLGKSNQVLVII
ncbi:unnamed protein product [Paramecium sonneborni]|uniref:Transmembrane protein n=1 Tax=Paramecium sonneborni TaxID=65129 RepID=A0A8S1R9F7_9CILI|nr:unnamed protein product [Paramecium sonneborni]